MENMKLIPHIELKVSKYGRSIESTLFLASHDVDFIRPELCCAESIKIIVYYMFFFFFWGGGLFGISSYGILL
jgi:hypothetical protein